MVRTQAKRGTASGDMSRGKAIHDRPKIKAEQQHQKNFNHTASRNAYPTPPSGDDNDIDDLCSIKSEESHSSGVKVEIHGPAQDQDDEDQDELTSISGEPTTGIIDEDVDVQLPNEGFLVDDIEDSKDQVKEGISGRDENQLISDHADGDLKEEDQLISDAEDVQVNEVQEEDDLGSAVGDDQDLAVPEEDAGDMYEDGEEDVAPNVSSSSTDPLPKVKAKYPMKEKATLHPHGLQPVETVVDNQWIYLFFRFCCERHKMYERRQMGVPRDQLTKDETMSKVHIGNVFRQLDPSSKNIRENILGKGDQSHVEVCFRLFLYCVFYSEDTWQELCKVSTGGIPTWNYYIQDLPSYENALYQKSIVQKQKIYYGGFQLVPPTIYFSDNRNKNKEMIHFAASLRLVFSIMLTDLPDRLLECKYAIDVSYLLQTIPTLGGFLSWNIICFLNDTPNFKWYYRNYATCGPGPRSYLSRIFGGTQQVINSIQMEEAGLIWLFENQYKYFSRLNEDPPHAWELGLKPGLRVLDIENALCWCHRYVNAYERKGLNNISQLPDPKYDREVSDISSEPCWCVEEKWLNSSSRNIYKDDLEELSTKLNHVIDKEEDCYEVEKVITRKGSRLDKKKDSFFRVRWKGYTPEEDTWERASSIKDGAEESLTDWIKWEDKVWECIEKVKKEYPYKKPLTPKSEEGSVDTTEAVERPSKRPRRVKQET